MISEILHSGLADYNELLKWSDLYCKCNKDGEWFLNNDDSLYRYIKELEQVLITGNVRDINTLRELRLDLYNLRERFVEKTMKSLNAGKEGGAA